MLIKIYKLIDSVTNEIRYVGKTKKLLRKRLWEHLTKRNLTSDTPKNLWIKDLLDKGVKPQVVLLEEVDHSIWEEKEKFWIQKIKSEGHKLTNLTEGGIGGIKDFITKTSVQKSLAIKRRNGTLALTEECKLKLRNSRLGKKMSQETKDKIADKLKHRIYRYDLNRIELGSWKGVRSCCRVLDVNRSRLWNAIKTGCIYKNSYWEMKIIPFNHI